MRHLFFTIAAILILHLTACTSNTKVKKTTATIDHVVFLWLSDSSNPTLLDSIKHHSEKLDTIPGIISLSMGEAIASTRPIVDDSFDLGLIFTFASEEEMQNYIQHEGHTDFITKWIKPHSKKVMVYDIKRK